jgi:hypothetical protein
VANRGARPTTDKPKDQWALVKRLWPASLPALGYGILKVLGWADSIAFAISLGGQLLAVKTFLETSLGTLAVGVTFLWTAYILFDANKRRAAYTISLLGIASVAYSAFLLGQQVPTPRVQLKYFNPFVLDKTIADIARVNGDLVTIPVRSNGFRPYANDHRIAAACRPVVPGVPLESADFVQLGMFQTIMDRTVLELRISKPFGNTLCKQDRPAMQCGVVMVKNDIAEKYNQEMHSYSPDRLSPQTQPYVDKKDMEFSVYETRHINVDLEGCPDNGNR